MLHHYGVDLIILPQRDGQNAEKTKYTALGASFLNGSTIPDTMIDGREVTEAERVNFFDKYRKKTPEAVFGGSIYLYREDE